MFVVIEGNQGLGKTTQTRLLIDYFNKNGIRYKSYFFPRYETFFGQMVAAFLRGEYGAVEQVSPYFTALMFANDRKLARDEIVSALDEGILVISDRWTSSNMAIQAAKIQDKVARAEFIRWVEDLEYGVFQQPKPDLTIYLRAEPEISLKNLREKQKERHLNGKADIEEGHEALIRNSFEQYELLARTLPKWKTLELSDPGDETRLRPIEDIHRDIIAILNKINSSTSSLPSPVNGGGESTGIDFR